MAIFTSTFSRAHAVLSTEPSIKAKISPDILKTVLDIVKVMIGKDAWTFYNAHKNDVVKTITIDKKVLWFTVHVTHDVKLSDVRFLVEQLAGPEPIA